VRVLGLGQGEALIDDDSQVSLATSSINLAIMGVSPEPRTARPEEIANAARFELPAWIVQFRHLACVPPVAEGEPAPAVRQRAQTFCRFLQPAASQDDVGTFVIRERADFGDEVFSGS